MVAHSIPHWQFKLIRRFPRIPFEAPAEILLARETFIARARNLSFGGMLLEAECDVAPQTQLHVHCHLPNGFPLLAEARVVHCRPGVRLGVQFGRFDNATRDALHDCTQAIPEYHRRSIRVPERFIVNLAWEQAGVAVQEAAQTILLSRHGCMLLAKAAPASGTTLTLGCPEKETSAPARVVFRHQDPDGLLHVGLEFTVDGDVWGIDFDADKSAPHA